MEPSKLESLKNFGILWLTLAVFVVQMVLIYSLLTDVFSKARSWGARMWALLLVCCCGNFAVDVGRFFYERL